MRRGAHIFLLLLILLCTFLLDAADGSADRSDIEQSISGITLFNGAYTNRTIGKAAFNIPGDLESNYMHALSLSREFQRIGKHFSLEVEGMFAKHHGKHQTGGHQNYEEYVLALFLRYHTFPWNNFIDTSFAVGEGLSLTSKTPARETQRNNKESQPLLNYLALELEFTLPKYPRVGLVYRIHHRSGIFGLFGGVKGASDFYLLGLRYKF